MIIKDKAWKFGDNIDTDAIIPARYLNTTNYRELAQHCMEGCDANFIKNVKIGGIIVAGSNFGCGSSREHAPIAIKEAGISCVIAKFFARIFFRNAINIGLSIFESVDCVDKCKPGNILQIDSDKGVIINLSNNEVYKTTAHPDFIQKIISLGGLKEYLKQELKRR